jgi:carboxypeptidase Taq
MSTAATSPLYTELVTKIREVTTLEGIGGLLGWDEMVMLPSGSSSIRGDQKSVLAGIIYDKKTDARLGRLLTELKEADVNLTGIVHERCLFHENRPPATPPPAL